MLTMILFLVILPRMTTIASTGNGDIMPFPFQDFLRIAGVKYWNTIQLKWYKCGDSSGCRCDDGCQESGDCCMDYLWNVTDPSLVNTTNINETMSKHVQKLVKIAPKQQKCLQLFPQMDLGTNDKFIMVDKCLSDKIDEEIINCARPSYIVPVLGNDSNLYSNIHCAKCNDVSSYKFLDMKIHCNQQEDLLNVTRLLSTGRCTLSPEKGDKDNIKRCNLQFCGSTKATLCRLFMGYIEFPYSKNIFCGDCLENVWYVDIARPSVIGSGPMGPTSAWSTTISLFSFNNLQQACPDGDFPGSFRKCIKKLELCGDNYELRNKQCVLIQKKEIFGALPSIALDGGFQGPSFQDSSFQNCLTLDRLQMLLYLTKESVSSPVSKQIKEIQAKLNLSNTNWTTSYFERESVLWRATNILVTNKNLATLKEYLSHSQDHGIKKIVLIASKKTINTTLYGYDHTRTFEGRKLCASVTKIPADQVGFVNSGCKKILLPNQTSVSNMSMINLELNISNGSVEESIYYCQKYHLHSSCFRQNINPSNYVIDNNYSLTFNFSDNQYTFAAQQYIPTLNGFQICWKETGTKTFEKYSSYSKTVKAKQYISVTGTSCSLVAYLIMFVAFYLLKDLRNTGGLYVLILVILLFLADIVFIINMQTAVQGDFCKWLGILLHFFLILVCEWTAVMAINLAIQFSKSSRASPRSSKAIYKKLLYCLCSTIVLFALIISLNETATIDFNYENSCWMGKFYPALAFYFIPVTIVYVACIISLSIVVYSIKQQQKHSEAMLGGNRNNINIYKIAIKLLVILGISECIGLIQIPTADPNEEQLIFNMIFSTIYDITRSFRGVLICIVYLVNGKTILMMKIYFLGTSKDRTKVTKSSTLNTDSSL